MYAKKGFIYIASKYGENGVCGLYPKGVRFIRHITDKILKKRALKQNGERNSDN